MPRETRHLGLRGCWFMQSISGAQLLPSTPLPSGKNGQIEKNSPTVARCSQRSLAKLKNAEEKAGDKRTIIRRNSVQGAGFVSYQAVILPKLSDRDVQNPNAGDSLRKIYGNAEATQIQDILNRAIRNRQQIFLNYRADLSKPKPTVSSSN